MIFTPKMLEKIELAKKLRALTEKQKESDVKESDVKESNEK